MAERHQAKYRRWVHPFRDHPDLAPPFDRALLSIGQQLNDLQARRGCTLQQLADGTHLSDRGLSHIGKAQSDPKLSTLVRIADFFGCDVVVSFRPARTAVR